jgi:DNA-binding transcriptional LysR family regulator
MTLFTKFASTGSMRLTEADLRLLRVLDAILDAGSIMRAADRLCVTSSAVSHSLRALRARFADPLFVRVGTGMQPTPLAVALRPSLQLGLAELARVLHQEVEFDPSVSRRVFSLACADLPLPAVVPDLIKHARQRWPNLDFRINDIQQGLNHDLASGKLDLVLAGGEMETPLALDREVMRRRIMSEPFVCLMANDQSANAEGEWSLDTYLKCPHVSVSTGGNAQGIVDDELSLRGLHRRVAVTVPSFAAAKLLVVGSDLIATVPLSIAQQGKERFGLKICPAPLNLPEAEAYLWWHPRYQHDTGHSWWRSQLMAAFAHRRL